MEPFLRKIGQDAWEPGICFLTKKLTTTLLTTKQGDNSVCIPRYSLSFFIKLLKVH